MSEPETFSWMRSAAECDDFAQRGFDDFLEGAVFADHFESCVGADFWDGVDVVAAKENAEVDKLCSVLELRRHIDARFQERG